MKIVFATNFCSCFRVRTFEMLARICNLHYFFYSTEDEWYWQWNYGIRSGAFRSAYLRGFQLTPRVRDR